MSQTRESGYVGDTLQSYSTFENLKIMDFKPIYSTKGIWELQFKMSPMGRLDMLTDSLLPEIMYFLPTKDAVRASLISKRWINLWVSLPILNFNFGDFCPEDVLTRGPFSTKVSENFTIKGDFMDRILLGCPNLEELELFAYGLNLSRILGGNLRSLVLGGCCNFKNIRVSIPTLRYFKVTVMSCQSSGIILENMSSLVKACVCFLTADDFPSAFYNSKAEILSGLSGVRDLELVLHGYESKGMLWHALRNCPDFENLKALHLESFDGSLLGCKDMLDCLMLHSPILADLTFYPSFYHFLPFESYKGIAGLRI